MSHTATSSLTVALPRTRSDVKIRFKRHVYIVTDLPWFMTVGDCTGLATCAETGQCIPKGWICNGLPNCPDSSDEQFCGIPCTFKS